MSVHKEGLGFRVDGEAAQQFNNDRTTGTSSPELVTPRNNLGTAVIRSGPDHKYRVAVLNHTGSASAVSDPDNLIDTLSKLQHEAGVAKIMGVGIQTPKKDDPLRHVLWKGLDTVPIRLNTNPEDNSPEHDMEKARIMRDFFTEQGTPIIESDPNTGEIQSSHIATLSDWEQSYSKMGQQEFWEKSMEEIDYFAKEFKGKRLVRINTTAQAGGVAGMLHPARRFIDEYNASQEEKGPDGHPIDFHWHTMNGHIDTEIAAKYGIDLHDPELLKKYGDPEKPDDGINVFKITKKMHNIIQGKELKSEKFTETDKRIHSAWSETQANRLQDVLNQPNTVYWIDDQQPLGLIQRIRENDPHASVIFRFHIQVQNDLAKAEGSQQKEVIDFLMDKMTGPNKVDAFLSHRSKDGEIDSFLPTDAQGNIDPRIADRVMFKVATADTEDGLGKTLTAEQREYYLNQTDEYLIESGQSPLNRAVGHMGQFARFDRAKNIPGVLASYKQFAEKMMNSGTKLEDLPEQLIVGFGAVDDPDGEEILADTRKTIAEEYPLLADKFKVIRLTYDRFDDRHMKALEDTCDIGLQLSTAEGCEDKITQMLLNGKPMIVANVGGMPPQIIDGVNGVLVDPHDHESIANHMVEYYTTIYPFPEKREKLAQRARETVNPEYTTLANIRDMIGIAAMVANKREEIPNQIALQREKHKRIPFVHEVTSAEHRKASTHEENVIYAA